jgi:hypothetical protein
VLLYPEGMVKLASQRGAEILKRVDGSCAGVGDRRRPGARFPGVDLRAT